MQPDPPIRQPLGSAVKFFVAAIVVLGMVGGVLIVAYSGYETSPKHGGTPVFVPAPQAYLLAATMFGMSVIGWVALVRERWRSLAASAVAVLLYLAVAIALTAHLGAQ